MYYHGFKVILNKHLKDDKKFNVLKFEVQYTLLFTCKPFTSCLEVLEDQSSKSNNRVFKITQLYALVTLRHML